MELDAVSKQNPRPIGTKNKTLSVNIPLFVWFLSGNAVHLSWWICLWENLQRFQSQIHTKSVDLLQKVK